MKKIKNIISFLNQRYIKAQTADEDEARHQFIFTVLILGALLLELAALFVSLTKTVYATSNPENVSLLILVLCFSLTFLLYIQSRRNYSSKVAFALISFYYLTGTYALFKFGYIIPQGLLIYILVIVVSGILISSRAAFIATSVTLLTLSVLAFLQSNNYVHPYTHELFEPLGLGNLMVYIVLFGIIFLVSWLSSRDIEISLYRARISEENLQQERKLLETKVKIRTKELELSQVEKSMEVYRFAEYGKMSSSLVHDLANPITAMSLNFSTLETSPNKDAMVEVRNNIQFMEQYVTNARKQLRSHDNAVDFDSKAEIRKAIQLLRPKAKSRNVTIRFPATKSNISLCGDPTKFSQVMSNVITNAIDAYDGSTVIMSRQVVISSNTNHQNNSLQIVVQDFGCGIPAEKLERIFDPFYTTKSSDRGTGLGLTIIRQIVHEHFKGTIKAKTTERTGTQFIINLPYRKENKHDK